MEQTILFEKVCLDNQIVFFYLSIFLIDLTISFSFVSEAFLDFSRYEIFCFALDKSVSYSFNSNWLATCVGNDCSEFNSVRLNA